jgi:hypothetical protein
MGLWDWVRGKRRGGENGAASRGARAAQARWLSAAESPFGVKTLDLRPVITEVLSTTKDPENAARATSWGLATAEAIPPSELGSGSQPIRCSLSYPVASAFPDGLLFAPRTMEEKWALFHRSGSIVAVRSWTGKVTAVARGARIGDRLVIDELTTADNGLGPFGEPVAMFDWLVRTHVLGQVLPLPIAEAELDVLAQVPLLMFGPFGRLAEFAASDFSPPPPIWPLRVFGVIVQAVQRGDASQVRALLAEGADPNVPSPVEGCTALHLAMSRGDVELMRALLAGGANPKLRTDRGMDPVGLGIFHGATPAILEELLAAGGLLDGVNLDGFGPLHAAAEANRPEIIPWLAGRGLALEARTARGLTPLHIACGLGHVDAARALLAAGADASAPSPLGSPREISEKEGHRAFAALLPGAPK